MAVEPDEDPDEEEPEDPPPPPELVAALDEMLSLAVEAPPPYYPDASDTDRLVHVLMAVGRLHALCHTHAGLLSAEPPPADEEERKWAAERDLEFIRRCADELVELAARCLRFAVWQWADLRPEGEPRRETRRNAAAEAREEALFELGIRAQRPRASLTADKDRVADFLRPTLAFAALQCADTAHELEDGQFPGTAGSTMVDLAASLLSDGDQIATAAGYSAWPGVGGGG